MFSVKKGDFQKHDLCDTLQKIETIYSNFDKLHIKISEMEEFEIKYYETRFLRGIITPADYGKYTIQKNPRTGRKTGGSLWAPAAVCSKECSHSYRGLC